MSKFHLRPRMLTTLLVSAALSFAALSRSNWLFDAHERTLKHAVVMMDLASE